MNFGPVARVVFVLAALPIGVLGAAAVAMRFAARWEIGPLAGDEVRTSDEERAR